MNWLQPHFYITYPVKPAQYNIVLLDLIAYERLKRNADFVQALKERWKNCAPGEEIVVLYDTKNKMPKAIPAPVDLERLKELHLNVFIDPRPFIKEQERSEEIHLLTERFFWHYPTVNLGSSRHALVLDYQIKGLGRNPLALRHDHVHSWGGLYLWQGLKAYIVGHLVQSIAPLGALNTTMLSIAASETDTTESSICQIMREAHATRVTQVATGFDPNMQITKEVIQRNFLKRIGRSKEEHLEQIIFHYAALYFMGVRHMSINRENITVEGPLIDYEDMLLPSEDSFELYVSTQISDKKLKLFPFYANEHLHTSSVHLYLDAIDLTVTGMAHLFGTKYSRAQITKKFIKMLKRLAKECFEVPKELMEITLLLLEQETIYCKGETGKICAKGSAKKFFSYVRKLDLKLTSTDEVMPYLTHHYALKLKRPKLRLKGVHEFNLRNSCDVQNLVEESFKRLRLETFGATALSEEELLSFSSQIHRLLSNHAQLFPFELKNGNIKVKSTRLKKLESELKLKLAPLGMTEIIWDKMSVDGHHLVRGFEYTLKGKNYYQYLAPQLFS